MNKLTHSDLYSLEEYAKNRDSFRQKVIDHKKDRRLPLGEHAALYFEDVLTMQYQIQEMLRIERIFEQKGVQEELDVYNPLIPDGTNWKATFMMEYEDVDERRRALAKLIGIERSLWIQVEGFEKIRPVANEDLDRETEDKTASVHFVRFELGESAAQAVRSNAKVFAGIDHPAYSVEIEMPDAIRASLTQDLH